MDKSVIERGYREADAALTRLQELNRSGENIPGDIMRDAIIQRFEFSYELMWKLFRKIHIGLRHVDRERVRSAYGCIVESGMAGWLQNRELSEQMMRDRNLTSHKYDETAADKTAKHVMELYYPEMTRVLAYLKQHFINASPLDNWIDRAEKN